MAAAVHLRLEAHAAVARYVQRADALGTVSLMRGQRHQIDFQLLQVDRHLAGGLRGVHVKKHAAFAADFAERRHVLDHADLVVDEHDGSKRRVGAQRGFEFFEVEQAVRFRDERRDGKAGALELEHRVEHCLVLGLHRDQVLALVAAGERGPFDREIVGFGRTGRPNDFTRIGVDQRGDLIARRFDRRARCVAERVRAARGIAELVREPWQHFGDDPRIDRRGGGIVEIDGKFHERRD